MISWKNIWMTVFVALFSMLHTYADTRFDYFFHAATQYRIKSQLSEAVALYSHCLEMQPDAPEVLFELGRINIFLRQDSVGLSMMRRAAATDTLCSVYQEALAAVLVQRRQLNEAAPYLERLSRLEPKRTDVLSQLVHYYISVGRNMDAIRTLDAIERIDGPTIAITDERFRLYMTENDSVAAFSQYEQLCREQPYELNNKARLARYYQSRGNEERAQQLYAEIREADPHNEVLTLCMLQQYEESHQDSLFCALRDSLIDEPSFNPETRRLLIWNKIAQVSEDEKAVLAEKVLDLFPNDESSLVLLLEYYGKRNDLENLEEIGLRGMNYYPEKLGYSYFLGLCYIAQGKNEEAVHAFRRGLDLRAANSDRSLVSDVYCLYGDACQQLQHTDKAFLAYDSALVYNRNNVQCLNNYAYYLSERGERLDEAEEMSARSLVVEPHSKLYLDTYAWILFKQKRYAEAQEYMEKVIPADYTDEQILADTSIQGNVIEHAGDIAWHNGMKESAIRFWKLAAEKDQTGTEQLVKKNRKHKYIR